MIIFGTKGVTTTPQRGSFYCPACDAQADYGLKRVKQFFTLYFIPLIPMSTLGEYIECNSCQGTFETTVLEYDPAEEKRIVAKFQEAIKQVMIHVLLADGQIDDAEVETLQDIYRQISGDIITKSQIADEIDRITQNNETLEQTLKNLQGSLNDQGKIHVISAALHIAMADGQFQEEEKHLLTQIGQLLGFQPKDTKEIIDQNLKQTPSQ